MAVSSERLPRRAADGVGTPRDKGKAGKKLGKTGKIAKREKPEVSGSEKSERPKLGAGKLATKSRTAGAAGATKSRPAFEAAEKPRGTSKVPFIVGGVALAVVAIGVAVQQALAPSKSDNEIAIKKDAPTENNTPAAPAVDTPAAPSVTPLDRAKKIVSDADQLERNKREGDAVNALDAALEDPWPTESKKLLQDTRAAVLGRFKSKISEASAVVSRGDYVQGRVLLADLKARCPDQLQPELISVQSQLEAGLARREKPPEIAPPADQPKEQPKEQPKNPGGDNKPAANPAAALERARFALSRTQVTKALSELDTETAHKALEGDATPYSAPEIQESFAIDKGRIQAVEKLVELVTAGFKTSIGENVEVPTRTFAKLSGKLVKVENGKIYLQAASSPATVATAFGKLALDPLFARALSAAKSSPEWYFYGRGAVLAAIGDKAHALEALEIAGPAIASAAGLKKQLEANDATLEPAPAEGPSTTGGPKPGADGGTIVFNPDDPDNPFGKKKSKRPRTWMDDTDGGVEWSQAYVIETEHYMIKTNVKKVYAQRWARILEALAARYLDIFQIRNANDFKYKKNEFDLYKSQKEFMAHENQSPFVGGFYEPWSKRLVTFQGPWEGADDATTLSIVAHEATHQFQNIACHDVGHLLAATFMLEGLATFFEGTVIRDEEVIIGRISSMRLKDLQRAMKDGTYVHLSELIRTPHASYSGFHYAHGWGLMHWCMFGPERKKAVKLLQGYWDLLCSKPVTGDDFEQYVKALGPGWSLDKLEQSWKDWVLALDIHNDPAIKEYEKRTGKKFPVDDYEPSEKEKKIEKKEGGVVDPPKDPKDAPRDPPAK